MDGATSLMQLATHLGVRDNCAINFNDIPLSIHHGLMSVAWTHLSEGQVG